MNFSNIRTHPTLRVLLLIVISVAVGLAAITHQSLWMDEGSSAFKSLMPTIKMWWAMTMQLGGSDTQMPVYMFLLWGWQKVGGASEYGLRLINLPWLVIAVLALRRVRFWPLVCMTSPFVLYYTGELRPYAMQIAGGALAAAAMFKVAGGRDKGTFEGLHATAGASLLLASSSLTAAVWSVGLWIGVLVMRTDWLRRGQFWIKLAPWFFGAATLGGYYVFTLLKGYRATGIEGGGLMSLFFGFYELIGLLGLGPGRNELRASPTALFPSLPLLLPALICIFGAWWCGVAAWIKTTPLRCVLGVACAVIIPIVILAGVGLAMDFRVLGRHLSPVIPAVLLPVAVSLSGMGKWKTGGRVLGGMVVCFAISSAISLKILEKHARDDYRRAAGIAIHDLKQGKNVWWQADMNATRYYAYLEGGAALVNAIQILESDPPSGLMFADVVVINRADLRYRHRDYQAELRRESFQLDAKFTGFEIWRAH